MQQHSPPPQNKRPSPKRVGPHKLAGALLALALPLTACGGGSDDAGASDRYDQPEELAIASATDNYNEVANETGSMNLTMDEFEYMSQTEVCDRLPALPDQDDFTSLARDLEAEYSLDYDASLALVVHGTIWCQSKFDAAFD